MKLYQNTTNAVVQALQMIFEEKKYADKVIEKVLKQNPKWGARDRRFIAETTYDIVRWYRLLREITGAAHNDFWRMMGAYLILKYGSVPDWQEFKGLDARQLQTRSAKAERKIKQSIPDWLDALGEKELGRHWEKELISLNEEAPVVIRVNTLKTTRGELHKIFLKEEIRTQSSNNFPDALVLEERQNVFRLPSFKEGLFEMQDAASQLIAPFMRVEPGMRVVDACAGAGGKTLHLAAIMKNKGRLIAMDVEQWKLNELVLRARRAGVSNLETKLIDSTKVIKRMEGTADRLLLDVPCSGLGVLKRNPDAKWKLSQKFVEDVKVLQQKILSDYCIVLKPGGLLTYATCSILPSEDEHQVKTFLEKFGDQFELLEEKRAWPSEGFDGFYMALLRRKA